MVHLTLHRVTISLWKKIVFLSAALIFLLPNLTYPISLDLAVFARGGEVLLKGGKLYTDYIDLKPPLIHYILAFAQLITPDGETGVRVFDIIWQMLTVVVLAGIVSKITNDERTGYTAGVLYALVYTAGFYESTYQCESFLALPLALFTYIQLFKSDAPEFRLAIGVMIGVCISLKFTFGIIAIIWIIDEIVFKKNGRTALLKNSGFVSLGILLSLIVIFLPTVHSVKTLNAFTDIIEYTSLYAALPVVDKELIRSAVFKTGGAIVEIYSLTYVFFAAFAGQAFFKKNDNPVFTHAVFLSILSIVLLIISAVTERKFFDYHYSRVYIPLCFLAACGIVICFDFLKTKKTSFHRAEKLLVVFCIPILVIFSPLVSWGSLLTGVSKAYFTDMELYNSLIERSHIPGLKSQRQQQQRVTNLLKSNHAHNVFVIGMDAARIGYFLQSRPVSKFSTAQYYLGSTASIRWRQDAYKEISTAQWLVGQENDFSPYTYDGKSAWQATLNDTLFAPYIYANFVEVENTGYYRILKRK